MTITGVLLKLFNLENRLYCVFLDKYLDTGHTFFLSAQPDSVQKN